MTLAILVPVLGRPHRVVPLLASIARATPKAHTIFLADPDDTPEHDAIRRARRTSGLEITLVAEGGNYAHKINVGVRLTTEPLIFMGADDVEFHPNWFAAACGYLDRADVVGTNDLCNRRVIRGEHSTHSLLTRDYANQGTIDEPDKVLHEGYEHEYVDDEFVATAKHRDQFAFAAEAVVEHLHPQVGKAPMDDLYAGQHRRMKTGRRLYRERRHLWTS